MVVVGNLERLSIRVGLAHRVEVVSDRQRSPTFAKDRLLHKTTSELEIISEVDLRRQIEKVSENVFDFFLNHGVLFLKGL